MKPLLYAKAVFFTCTCFLD